MTRGKFLFWTVAVLILAPLAYFLVVFNWSYSDGERAGWIQKFSSTGWLCKTWEGEMSMVSLPGSTPEKFYFTVWDEKVADQVAKAMGKRVSLQYEQKVGIPSSCFGETRYYVKGLSIVETISLTPGVTVPAAGATAPAVPAQK
ncbi:MAG TPA: hypothetical protein VGP97_03100 [Burkholderiales bacterium]|nr:hypothetical protein [Burkholderiales bacterium]